MEMLKNRRILVVDDEPELRELLADELRERGGEIVEASDGTEAFALVRSREVDAVVTDIRMPGGSGLALLDNLMTEEQRPERPVVLMVSGFADITEEEALARGAVAVFGKPYDFDALALTLGRALLPPGERWRRREGLGQVAPMFSLTLPGYGEATETGRLRLGRGGLCVQSAADLPAVGTRLRFDLRLGAAGSASIQGSGVLRWLYAPGTRREPVCGIEFEELADSCRAWVVEEIARVRPTAFIPRS